MDATPTRTPEAAPSNSGKLAGWLFEGNESWREVTGVGCAPGDSPYTQVFVEMYFNSYTI